MGQNEYQVSIVVQNMSSDRPNPAIAQAASWLREEVEGELQFLDAEVGSTELGANVMLAVRFDSSQVSQIENSKFTFLGELS